MELIRNGVVALVLFTMLVGLFTTYTTAVNTAYNVPSDEINDADTGLTIGERFEDLPILDDLEDVTNIFDPTKYASFADLVGNLVVGGLGILKGILHVFTTPFQIADIITQHYELPWIFLRGILVIMCVLIAFIVISSQLKDKV